MCRAYTSNLVIELTWVQSQHIAQVTVQCNSSIINTESVEFLASILLFLLQLGTQVQYEMRLKAC